MKIGLFGGLLCFDWLFDFLFFHAYIYIHTLFILHQLIHIFMTFRTESRFLIGNNWVTLTPIGSKTQYPESIYATVFFQCDIILSRTIDAIFCYIIILIHFFKKWQKIHFFLNGWDSSIGVQNSFEMIIVWKLYNNTWKMHAKDTIFVVQTLVFF